MSNDSEVKFVNNPFLRELEREVVGIFKLLKSKNAAYGNAALNPVRIFSKAPADEQINVRIDDKLSRLARGHDAGEDVELDLIGYLLLKRVQRRLDNQQES